VNLGVRTIEQPAPGAPADAVCQFGKGQHPNLNARPANVVIPAKEGIQGPEVITAALDPRLRGGDDTIFCGARR
jgi:hypothetical protein